MDSLPQALVRQEIDFGNGRRAQMVRPSAETTPNAIVQALGLACPNALMLIFGGAGGMEADAHNRVAGLFRESLVPAVIARRALIVDGGTHSGIMYILGEIIGELAGEIVGKIAGGIVGEHAAEREDRPSVLGVAPAAKVTYPGKGASGKIGLGNMGPGKDGAAGESETVALDPNHSHFVLTPTAEWGSETATIFAVTGLLADGNPVRPNVVALLANGGGIAKEEAYGCAARGWPLVVVAGTGRLADEIADAHARLPTLPADPKISAILTSGVVSVFPPQADAAALTKLLKSLGM